MPIRWVNYLWDEPHPASSQDFEQLESHWGVRLPEDYKSIAATYQGTSPEPGVFNVGLVTVEMFIYPVANSFTELLANLHDGRILLA
jgi:SMI1/KNR4 family protein SUKH-1